MRPAPSWTPVIRPCARRRRAIAIPRRFALGVREMFALQPRLEHPRGRRALRVLEHPRFRASYDLLLLRAQLGMASAGHGRLVDTTAEASGSGARAHGR